MKGFRNVEETRRSYHADRAKNSVHRSSLLVPEIKGSDASISFLNHFLLKRGYAQVGCRITAIDPLGKRIESRLHIIDEPRVYSIPLTGMVANEVATYLVEFFAAQNLFIPFPAVMVNHEGRGFLNTVHSFNRVLNDVFEDDEINETRVAEASIDVCLGDGVDTFVMFSAGPQPCRGPLDLELIVDGRAHTASVALDVPRLCFHEISLSKVFPKLGRVTGGVLRVRQPQQFLFYGRILAGIRQGDGSFSANHSYYDTSGSPEYWDDARESARVYPLFSSRTTRVRTYPIMSPGGLRMTLDGLDDAGNALGTADVGVLKSPGGGFLDLSVEETLAAAGVRGAAAFTLRAAPTSGNTPTRINHQIVYLDGAGRSPLGASINVSLLNPNVFSPPGKKGFIWGQVPFGGDLDSDLGIVGNRPDGDEVPVSLTFYGLGGKIDSTTKALKPRGAVRLNGAELAGEAGMPETAPIWYVAESARSDLAAFTASRNSRTGHSSGEHNF